MQSQSQSQARAQTGVFRQLVGELMGPPTLAVGPETSVRDLVGRMTGEKASCAVVIDEAGCILGIVTEQDVTRRVALRATPQTKTGEIMTEGVQTIGLDDFLFRGISRMRRFGHRHMPVVATDGKLAGHLELDTALAAASERTMARIDLLTRESTVDGMGEVKAAQIALAQELFADEVPTPEIQALLTDINNAIYRRLTDAGVAAMAADGKGEPPVAFAAIVMGSGGRDENMLFPDQDNGFILADYEDREHNRIDGWFRDLAVRLNDMLDQVGFPLCKGYVMAQNPLWRKTESQWRAQIAGWQKKRDTTALRLADIFFDFRWVYGDRAMASRLRRHVTELTKGNHSFLREMYRDDAEHGIALGWFGRFITVRDNAKHRGKINLKHTGTLPLIEGARLLALREGIEDGPTLKRIDLLAEKKILDADEQDYLSGAFRHMNRLILRQQLRDHAVGGEATAYVSPKAMSAREKDYLRDCFRAVRTFRSRLRSEFTGEVF